MKLADLVRAGLKHHRRTNAGVAAGTAIAAAVLVGALAVGDSVRATLATQVEQRTGRIGAVLPAGDRFFRDALADRIADTTGETAAPVIVVPGVASTPDGSHRATDVVLLGVDERFFALGGDGTTPVLPEPGTVLLNGRLAARLAASAGDRIVLRVHLPSPLPREALLAEVQDVTANVRVTVAAIVGPGQFGDFGLQTSQVPPMNAFVSRAWLQAELEQGGRSNLLLAGAGAKPFADALDLAWTLDDAGLHVETPPGGGAELVATRVFIDPPVAAVAAVAAALPQRPAGILTYFVNTLAHGERETPYSMVTAIAPDAAPGVVPPDLADDEIVINDWLADDLDAGPGDTITLAYYVIEGGRVLRETSAAFRVRAITPMTGLAADRTLMPEFPGIASAESSQDWEPSIPIDLGRVRDTDEAYWQEHRGTPKAFITLAAGRARWANLYGDATALRWTDANPDEIAAALRAGLDPADVGFVVRDVRAAAATARAATDFGGLFIGLSMFLVASALVLTSLLFALGVEQRGGEIGTLLAVGWRRARVRRLLLSEALVLACVGAVAGAVAGLGYTAVLLLGLETIWRDAVGDVRFAFSVTAMSIAIGIVAAVVTALAAIAWTARRQVRWSVPRLLGGGALAGDDVTMPCGRLAPAVSIVGVVGAVIIVVLTGTERGPAAIGAFFGAGTLLLIAGLAAMRLLLGRLARATSGGRLTLDGLGVRSAVRRRGRSLATVALLACGCFLVIAVGANRLDPTLDAETRGSGTGGFALWGSTTIGVVQDLDDAEGRAMLGLDRPEMADVSIVPFRVRDGDEASCLNLAVAPNPRLVGVDPAALAERGAFTFAGTLDDVGDASPWTLLAASGDDAVPAIGDQASVMWALHMSIGDTLDYRDEHGRPFRVRIVGTVAGSLLQGNLLVDETRFRDLFPSEAGFRMFLVDTPPEAANDVAATLNRTLGDLGATFVPAAERLATFTAVQNTYLAIFQVLGGLGLLLGSGGLGMVVLRNVLERRGELALLAAVGWPRRAIRRLVLGEHLLLLAAGLVIGTVAALIAVIPALRSPGGQVPYAATAVTIVAIGGGGVLWVVIATRIALRGRMLGALRDL